MEFRISVSQDLLLREQQKNIAINEEIKQFREQIEDSEEYVQLSRNNHSRELEIKELRSISQSSSFQERKYVEYAHEIAAEMLALASVSQKELLERFKNDSCNAGSSSMQGGMQHA